MTVTVSYAFEPVFPEFQANSSVFDDQFSPDVLGLSNGAFVVAYGNSDTGDGFPALDFYDAGGGRLGAFREPVPSDRPQKAIGQPSLAQMTNGNIVVAWNGNGVEAKIYTPSGDGVGNVLHASPAGTGGSAYTEPQVAALKGGGFVATYTYVHSGGSGSSILLETFDSSGNDLGGAVANSSGISGAHSAVTALNDGGFVVVFTDNSGQMDLRARIFNANGTARPIDAPSDGTSTPTTDDFLVGNSPGFDVFDPALATLPNGNFAFAFTDKGWGGDDAGNTGITLTIMRPDGSFVLNDLNNFYTHVNNGFAGDDVDAAISVLANGFIVVTWTREINPGEFDIRSRVFDQTGNAVTDELGVTNSLDLDEHSAVSALGSGKIVVAWQDSASGGLGHSPSDGNGDRISSVAEELVRTTTGDAANDFMQGDALRDNMFGNAGNDSFFGMAGDDVLDGGTGNDVLDSGLGVDRITGGPGSDTMFAGLDNDRDTFLYLAKTDVGKSAAKRDHIFQFDRAVGKFDPTSDKINLSLIDADKGTRGDQKFRYVGAFVAPVGKQPDGEIMVVKSHHNMKVLIDFNGDTTADAMILVHDVTTLHKYDFVL